MADDNASQRPAAKPSAGGAKGTPAADLQPEETGTPASGNSGKSTAAEAAMKQTSKTPHETGSSGGGKQ